MPAESVDLDLSALAGRSVRARSRHGLPLLIDDVDLEGVLRQVVSRQLRGDAVELGVRVLSRRVTAEHGGLAVGVTAPGLDEVERHVRLAELRAASGTAAR